MSKILMDVECYPNYFCIGFKSLATNKTTLFEISEEKNEIHKMYHYFKTFNGFLITFNGLHYDEILIKYLIHHYEQLKQLDYLEITKMLKYFSDLIIDGEHSSMVQRVKYLKLNHTSIDLFCYWSKMLRMSKKISLKSLGIQLGYPVVQELPYKPDSILKLEDLPKLRHYNTVHDLGILELLLNDMDDKIRQRSDAMVKYNFGKECYSWDGVKLGLNILLKEYCLENNINYKNIENLRTPFPEKGININEIILPCITFEKTDIKTWITIEKKKEIINCNSFYTLFEHLKTRTVFSTKELNYTVVSKGVKYDIKSGGLHSWHENDIVVPDLTKFIMRDKDVSSYYPTLGSEYGFVPQHLPGMGKLIKKLKTLRLVYKAEGNKKDAELYKLALNGGYYGNLNNEYSPMFDPLQLLSVTINGQLFLLMLCEWLEKENIVIDACNTDGITAIIPIEKIDIFEKLCNQWEKITLMELEAVDYTKVIRKNINNYIAVTTNNEVKRKGLFKFLKKEIPLGDSCDELVISKALDVFYVNNISPDDFISNPDKYKLHIYDYCKSNKISKDYEVFWNGEIQQNLNRYYFVRNAPYLFKKKKDKSTLEHVNVGEGVNLFNDYIKKPWKDYNINYSYYISKTNKIINELNNLNQLSLW